MSHKCKFTCFKESYLTQTLGSVGHSTFSPPSASQSSSSFELRSPHPHQAPVRAVRAHHPSARVLLKGTPFTSLKLNRTTFPRGEPPFPFSLLKPRRKPQRRILMTFHSSYSQRRRMALSPALTKAKDRPWSPIRGTSVWNGQRQRRRSLDLGQPTI